MDAQGLSDWVYRFFCLPDQIKNIYAFLFLQNAWRPHEILKTDTWYFILIRANYTHTERQEGSIKISVLKQTVFILQ